MNLENLNLVELDAQECQVIDGGFIPLLILGADLFLCSFFASVYYHEHFK